MASGTTTRRKRNATVNKMGGEMADDPARVKKLGSRKYEASYDSKRWCCIVLGVCGWRAIAPTSRGAAALFRHAVAADVVPGRAWDAAKKMKRKGVKLAAPKRGANTAVSRGASDAGSGRTRGRRRGGATCAKGAGAPSRARQASKGSITVPR